MSAAKRTRVSSLVKTEMGGGGAKLWGQITELARLPSIVADLGQGYPDFNGDASARNRACDVIQNEARLNQYSLVNGLVPLRDSLSRFYAQQYSKSPVLNSQTEILITSSGTESLFAAITAVVNPGDEVIIFDPMFPWYAPNVRMAGGVIRAVPLSYPDFKVNKDVLRAAFSSKTKLVIVNSPHNPTGHVLTWEEGKMIRDLCVEFDCLCLSDEVYEQYAFDKKVHLRMCDFPDMRDRTLTVGSASKMFSLTGWRVGWLYGPEDWIAASRAVHSFASYCAPTPLQEGVRAALDNFQVSQELNSLFLNNATRLKVALEQAFPGLSCVLPEGGYFLVCDVSQTKYKTDMVFCSALAKEHGVVAVPMSVFYNDDGKTNTLVRFAICKTKQVIDNAVKALQPVGGVGL